MKKLFTAFILFLNILPTFAALPPRDDREGGTGLLGGLFIFVIFFIAAIIKLKNEDKNK